jgi:hypothetical protein
LIIRKITPYIKKLYSIVNKEQIAEKAKAYYLKNHDKIKEKI